MMISACWCPTRRKLSAVLARWDGRPRVFTTTELDTGKPSGRPKQPLFFTRLETRIKEFNVYAKGKGDENPQLETKVNK